jgi:glycosyltransferase involved in cell wall biosynthesis
MYVGNLEVYQGVDLMLDSFSEFLKAGNEARLVIVGGQKADIQRYQAKTQKLGITGNTRFLGPQPVSRMSALFEVSDVLISPRIRGNNTPMKIYSYLASGKAILATALPTHTQVLTSEVALLVPPDTRSFAGAMKTLAGNEPFRLKLAAQAQDLARTRYSQESFQKAVTELYDGNTR